MSTAPYALLFLAVRALALAVPATTLVVLAVVARATARRGRARLGHHPDLGPWSLLA